MKLKASPARQPASRQGAGKGFLCAAIQQTQEWALGSGARCAQLRQQVLRLGCEKPVGEHAEEAWNDIPATPLGQCRDNGDKCHLSASAPQPGKEEKVTTDGTL